MNELLINATLSKLDEQPLLAIRIFLILEGWLSPFMETHHDMSKRSHLT